MLRDSLNPTRSVTMWRRHTEEIDQCVPSEDQINPRRIDPAENLSLGVKKANTALGRFVRTHKASSRSVLAMPTAGPDQRASDEMS